MPVSAESIRTDYLQLLLTQLRNQDPLEPMDNNEMTTQLAQLSQLEHLEGMSRTFEEALGAARMRQATDLIGKQISFLPPDGQSVVTGRVEAVSVVNGVPMLRVGTSLVDPATVLEVAP
jgi:flagellar basal-body rod modification protein FlgD